VVDCFDALTVDRPYRKALPREEAIDYLQQESGRMFDPAIVDLFVSSVDVWNTSLIPDAPMRAIPTPALAVPPPLATPAGVLRGARDPMLPWPGTVARMVPFATFAVYLRSEDGCLWPRLAVGLGAPRLAGFSVRRGERVVGWVAVQGRPYVGVAHVRALERDGSRWDFEDFADDPELGLLRSTVAVPLLAEDELAGVLALYHLGSRPYGDGDLSHLLALAPEIARTLPSLPDTRVSR
jgi:GAF domain-containing protein